MDMSKDKSWFSYLRLFRGKIAIIGFLSIGLFVFSQCKNQRQVFEPGETIKLQSWKRMDVIKYCRKNQIDTGIVGHLIELALFRENVQCIDTLRLHAPVQLPAVKESVEKIFAHEELYQMAMSLCEYIYTTVPEMYLDNDGSYAIKYKINKNDLFKTLSDLQSGSEVAQCGEYASLASELLTSASLGGKGIIASTRSMSTDSGQQYNHIVCVFYQRRGDRVYGVVIDPMYGYIFPARGSAILELSDLQNKEDFTNGYLSYLPDSILSQKRFLTDSIWPCNFLSALECSYYKGERHALKLYELHQAEDIRLLNFKPMDTLRYERDLRDILIKNIPASL